MEDIHPSLPIHNEGFYASVMESIKANGMYYPLIVMPTTIREWKQMMEITPSLLPPPDGDDDKIVYQIRCGNNRYYAAKELGYKLIETKRVYSLEESSSECRVIRKWKNES